DAGTQRLEDLQPVPAWRFAYRGVVSVRPHFGDPMLDCCLRATEAGATESPHLSPDVFRVFPGFCTPRLWQCHFFITRAPARPSPLSERLRPLQPGCFPGR